MASKGVNFSFCWNSKVVFNIFLTSSSFFNNFEATASNISLDKLRLSRGNADFSSICSFSPSMILVLSFDFISSSFFAAFF